MARKGEVARDVEPRRDQRGKIRMEKAPATDGRCDERKIKREKTKKRRRGHKCDKAFCTTLKP